MSQRADRAIEGSDQTDFRYGGARSSRWFLAAAVALAGLAGAPAGFAAEREVDATARVALSVTVYNRDLGLVGETRRIALEAGENVLALTDVSPRLQPETLLLEGAGIRLLEQSLQFDLLTPRRILEKSVGGPVWVVRSHPQTGEDSYLEAELLSVAEGTVVRIGERIETAPPGRLAFPGLPEGLRERPTLVARVDSAAAGERDLHMRYLTGGLTWQADYLAEIAADGSSLALTGLVTLTNTSGLDYPDARLRLVAGEVSQAGRPVAMRAGDAMMMEAQGATAPGLASRPMGDRHLYEVDRPVTLADRETKQVILLSAAAVPVVKEYRFEDLVAPQGGAEEIGPLQARIVLSFENGEDGPGRPLPGGVIRVYQASGGGEVPVFIGEDRIGHTPEGEEVRLEIGRAFDVTGRARRTRFERLSNKVYETGQAIEIANAKAEAVTVKLVGHLPVGWRMMEESAAHESETANRIVWPLQVPAGGKARLTYRLRVTRP